MRLIPVIVLTLSLPSFSTHRMCLNYESPFNLDETFNLCRDFEKFGCCTKEKDGEIHNTYVSIINQLPLSLKENCSDVIRDLLCQECSEYSAHQYDLERGGAITSLPGLCRDFCEELFQTCREAIKLLTNDTTLTQHLQQEDEEAFCNAVNLQDRYYCYPLQDELAEDYLEFYQLPSEKPCTALCIEEVANKITSPVSVRHAGDNTHRLFVVEQIGVVWVFLSNWTKLHPPFLNKSADVACHINGYDERGFLDIQFHPEYSRNGLFYIFYSIEKDSEDAIRISELQVSDDDMNRANLSYERVLLEVGQPYENHNGGQLLFGEDGYLYIFIGDGGSAGDPHGNGQNRSSLLGKVLRVDVTPSGGRQYSIPPDNPFLSDATIAPEIYAYGMRNPWRCTFDPKGRLFCADVGQNLYEEVDIIVKGGNYGWSSFEAEQCFDEKTCRDADMIENHILPIHSYNTSWGKSITGGNFFSGNLNPTLKGKYLFGDFMSGRMALLRENKKGKWKASNVCMPKKLCKKQNKKHKYPKYILTFGKDESGAIYFATTSNPNLGHRGGRIYKLSHGYKTKNLDRSTLLNVKPTVLHEGSWLESYKPTPEGDVQIRLIGAGQGRITTKGRVEIRPKGGRWSTVCGNAWNLEDGHVICRMLGFHKAREFSRGEFGPGRGRVRFDRLECNGDEDHIDECDHSGWRPINCSHAEDASVWCDTFS